MLLCKIFIASSDTCLDQLSNLEKLFYLAPEVCEYFVSKAVAMACLKAQAVHCSNGLLQESCVTRHSWWNFV